MLQRNTDNGPGHLFCFGAGYSAHALARRLLDGGWTVSGTARTPEKAAALRHHGMHPHRFDRDHPLAPHALDGVTHVLSSVPPDDEGDPVLDAHGDDLAARPGLAWIGYLSTTGVYGDTGGRPVDETAPPRPSAPRSRRRVAAEELWLALWRDHGLPVHVFRLAGIYGPGRNTLEQVRSGQARRIDKPGHVFSRIHVDDIAACLEASIATPAPGAVYNVCDDEPAAPADVVAHACRLLGVAPPALVAFAEAEAAMSPMARSFWEDNRRVLNDKIKTDLGVALRYPTYREGLAAIARSLPAEASPS